MSVSTTSIMSLRLSCISTTSIATRRELEKQQHRVGPAINPTSTWDSNFMHLCIPRQPASWPALASNLQGYRAFADQTSAAATVIATVEQQSRGQQAHRHITHCC
jgi:hypothetical protein